MNTVTQAQVDLIDRLKAERKPTGEALAALTLLRLEWSRGVATELRAEQVIGKMVSLPMLYRASFVPAGLYETAVGLVRVYYGQKNNRMLAKLVLKDEDRIWFQYLGLANRHVSANSRRLTAEEVGDATLAMDSTVCLMCGRRLDVPESVKRGIGPTCFENYGSI